MSKKCPGQSVFSVEWKVDQSQTMAWQPVWFTVCWNLFLTHTLIILVVTSHNWLQAASMMISYPCVTGWAWAACDPQTKVTFRWQVQTTSRLFVIHFITSTETKLPGKWMRKRKTQLQFPGWHGLRSSRQHRSHYIMPSYEDIIKAKPRRQKS